MKYSVGLVAASAALASAVPNTPHPHIVREAPSTGLGEVTVLEAKYSVSDRDALPALAPNATTAHVEFLKKYQPLSEAAAKAVAPVTKVKFASTGSCSREYPCFSVERGGVATIGDKEEITREQMSAILDDLTKKETCAFNNQDPTTPISGLRISLGGAVLEVISPPADLGSDILAGMVFDMYKLQCENVATNSIRAVAAKTDDKERPPLAMCVYPEGVDPVVASAFCRGFTLDGKLMPGAEEAKAAPQATSTLQATSTPQAASTSQATSALQATPQVEKRDLLDSFTSVQGFLNLACSFLSVEILCQGD